MPLPVQGQRMARSNEQSHLRRTGQDRLDEREVGQQMLHIVQHQQQGFIRQMVEQRGAQVVLVFFRPN